MDTILLPGLNDPLSSSSHLVGALVFLILGVKLIYQARFNQGWAVALTVFVVSGVFFLVRHVGVCRDFAHLGIALCRSINIPARIVVGYLHELAPMDLHAWFEAFAGGAGIPSMPHKPTLRAAMSQSVMTVMQQMLLYTTSLDPRSIRYHRPLM